MISNIKSILKRIVIIALIISMQFSIASCNKGNNGIIDKTVSAEAPWFNGEIVDVELGLDPQRAIEDMSPRLAGADDNNIVVFADGDYKVTDWDKVKTNADFAIKNISVINRDTKQLKKTIDLYRILEPTDWPETALYIDGKLIVKCESWESETNTYYKRDYYIDLDSESIIDTQVYEIDDDLQYSGSYTVGDYRIETLNCYGRERKYCQLRVFSPDGKVTEIDVKDSKTDIYEIPVILTLNDSTALVPAAVDRSYKYYELDLGKFKLTEAKANKYDWLDVDQLLHSRNGHDSNVFFTSPQGVSMIDMNEKTVEKVFDYSWCGVNRAYLRNLEIADCSEDNYLLCGQYNSPNMFTSRYVNSYTIVELTKAEINPHAGKTIVELYTPDGKVDETISDAIIKFNNSNSNYFIQLSDRYNRKDYLNFDNVSSHDDYEAALLNANAELSNDLAMDLMNGEGPDILMNTSSLGQLNNDNYLVDLSPYITSLESEGYFTNIVNGARISQKLYQLPICFTIEGIQTDPQYAGKTRIGFSTDEYTEFLYETLNGEDIINYGQSLYFAELFNGMSNSFIVDNKVDFSNQDFAELAAFVKDNVKQNSVSWDLLNDESTEIENFTTEGNKTAYHCNCPGISGYLVMRAQIKNGTAILGIPSADGRGPMFGTKISVAVSKHAVNIDACIDFINILLSDEIQEKLVMNDNLVINRTAFRNGCNAAIEYFNSAEGSQNLYDYAAGTYVTCRTKFSAEDVDNLENTILSCSKTNAIDSAINLILIEEMPAYFCGQKELSEVVVIVQDRVQKTLDERG